MSIKVNKALVRQMVDEVWNQGKLAVVDEIIAPSYRGYDPSYPVPIEGPAGFKQWVATARTAFPDFQITLEELIAEGDKVVGRITMRGTHTGSLMGIPATGRQVSFRGMFIRRVANGQFVQGWDTADMFSLMQQLGLISIPQ